nr:hypothetical protein BaRGS_010602 [Batillaria attramentaria]
MTSLTPERLASIRRPKCPVHADRPSELYCPTHETAICQLCATSKHRKCPEVKELEDKMGEARTVLEDLIVKLKAGQSEFQQVIIKLDQYLLDIDKTTRDTLVVINENFDHLQSLVEVSRNRVIKVVEEENDKAKDAARDKKTCLIERSAKMESHQKLVERTTEILPPAFVVSNTASRLENRVDELDFSIDMSEDIEVITMTSADGQMQ